MDKRLISTIVPYDRNPRKNQGKPVEAVLESLRRHGQVKPIVLSAAGHPFDQEVVCCGHTTLEALKRFGAKEVAVVVKEFASEAEFVDYNIRDNKSADFAEWDEAELASLAGEFEISLDEMGFTADDFTADEEEPKEIQEDEVPEPPADPITKPGDLWLLGDHRLLCGDSTKAEDVARLMGGAKADMMFTDPPYGVNYEGGHFHSGDVNIKRKREKLADDDTTEIYPAFLPVALTVVDGPCYMWFAGSKARDVYNAVYDCGCDVHALIIWHKTNATYAAMNAQYKQRHEPCLYFKPKGSTLRWCGESTEATVWNQDRDGINEFHPTQKPVALAAKAMGNHKADLVLDAFAGSGSTLIAAEQLGRKCYGMEISPAYCDVIVSRWEKLTGKKATLEVNNAKP